MARFNEITFLSLWKVILLDFGENKELPNHKNAVCYISSLEVIYSQNKEDLSKIIEHDVNVRDLGGLMIKYAN